MQMDDPPHHPPDAVGELGIQPVQKAQGAPLRLPDEVLPQPLQCLPISAGTLTSGFQARSRHPMSHLV